MDNTITSNQPIGILGGTFDPVHNGHLRSALEICQILNFALIKFIPCQLPVHKPAIYAQAHHRLAMLELATASIPQFSIDDQEIRRKTPSYMIDTLQSLRQEFPIRPLCLIMGIDAFLNLPQWRHWQQLVELAHIVIATRPGWEFIPEPALQRFLNQHQLDDMDGLRENTAGGIYLQVVTALDIRSTVIRQQFQSGYAPNYLLPDSVQNYIKKQHLYGYNPH